MRQYVVLMHGKSASDGYAESQWQSMKDALRNLAVLLFFFIGVILGYLVLRIWSLYCPTR